MVRILLALFLISGCGVAKQTFKAENVIFQYELYFDLHETFKVKVVGLKDHELVLASETDPIELRRLKMELNAYRSTCRSLAATYNADSQKLNRTLFKDMNLPHRLDANECN